MEILVRSVSIYKMNSDWPATEINDIVYIHAIKYVNDF